MTRSNRKTPSRRKFIQQASAISAAGLLPTIAKAKDGRSSRGKKSTRRSKARSTSRRPDPVEATDQVAPPAQKDLIKPINLGAVPTPEAFGTVIVPKSNLIFLTFSAAQIDPHGNFQKIGTAVVELTGCEHWQTRFQDDKDGKERLLDLDSLAECQTYEVQQSSWAEKHKPKSVAITRTQKTTKLRHFVITYYGECEGVCSGGATFEFLAEKISVQVLDAPDYAELNDYMDYVNSAA